jgi:hypothetical protein
MPVPAGCKYVPSKVKGKVGKVVCAKHKPSPSKKCYMMVKHHRVQVSCKKHSPHKVPVHGRHTTAVSVNHK